MVTSSATVTNQGLVVFTRQSPLRLIDLKEGLRQSTAVEAASGESHHQLRDWLSRCVESSGTAYETGVCQKLKIREVISLQC